MSDEVSREAKALEIARHKEAMKEARRAAGYRRAQCPAFKTLHPCRCFGDEHGELGQMEAACRAYHAALSGSAPTPTDTDRLDWLQRYAEGNQGLSIGGVCTWSVCQGKKRLGEGDDLREAIDEARSNYPPSPTWAEWDASGQGRGAVSPTKTPTDEGFLPSCSQHTIDQMRATSTGGREPNEEATENREQQLREWITVRDAHGLPDVYVAEADAELINVSALVREYLRVAVDRTREEADEQRDRLWCKAIIPEGPGAISRITGRVIELRGTPVKWVSPPTAEQVREVAHFAIAEFSIECAMQPTRPKVESCKVASDAVVARFASVSPPTKGV